MSEQVMPNALSFISSIYELGATDVADAHKCRYVRSSERSWASLRAANTSSILEMRTFN